MTTKLNCKVILGYMYQNQLTPNLFCKRCNITKEEFISLMSNFSTQKIDTLINIYIGTGINILNLIEERT